MNDESANQTDLSADRPITRPEEDLLQRVGFANDVAAAIRDWKKNDSLVIAIQGPWGSGKSSLKNLITSSLPQDALTEIIEFNPWQWAGQGKLFRAFFREIGQQLNQPNIAEEQSAVAQEWNRYADALRIGKAAADIIRQFAAIALFILAAVAGVGGILGTSSLVATLLQILAVIGLLLGLFIKRLTGVADAVANFAETRFAVTNGDLNSVRARLRDALTDLDEPILIVIDDIDRLNVDETKQLFQLVKANGNLPNINYLLFFDRPAVEDALSSISSTNGEEYLDKIVQVTFDVPHATQAQVDQVVTKRLDKLLSTHVPEEEMFDESRWGNIYYGAASDYFDNLRDVYRFFNTFQFHLSNFLIESILEVNPVDLFALECLRVFEPNVYHALKGQSEALTGAIRRSRATERLGEQREQVITDILSEANDETRPAAQEILARLFPSVKSVVDDINVVWSNKYARTRRICAEEYFETYFALGVRGENVAEFEIAQLLDSGQTGEEVATKFESFRKRGVLLEALHRAATKIPTLNPGHSPHFLAGLFIAMDGCEMRPQGMFSASPQFLIMQIVRSALEVVGEAQRAEVFTKAVRESEALRIPADIVDSAEKALEENEDSAIFKGKEQLNVSREEVLRNIQNAAERGELKAHPALSVVLSRWKQWEPSKVQTFIDMISDNPSVVLNILRSSLSPRHSAGVGDHVAEFSWKLNESLFEDLVSPEVVVKLWSQVKEAATTSKDRAALEEFETYYKKSE